MMEVAEESDTGPSHKQRTALFLAAMRHLAIDLADRGDRLEYVPLDHPENTPLWRNRAWALSGDFSLLNASRGGSQAKTQEESLLVFFL